LETNKYHEKRKTGISAKGEKKKFHKDLGGTTGPNWQAQNGKPERRKVNRFTHWGGCPWGVTGGAANRKPTATFMKKHPITMSTKKRKQKKGGLRKMKSKWKWGESATGRSALK